jgi:hypothetical protein
VGGRGRGINKKRCRRRRTQNFGVLSGMSQASKAHHGLRSDQIRFPQHTDSSSFSFSQTSPSLFQPESPQHPPVHIMVPNASALPPPSKSTSSFTRMPRCLEEGHSRDKGKTGDCQWSINGRCRASVRLTLSTSITTSKLNFCTAFAFDLKN